VNYWIFIVTAHKVEDETFAAEAIFRQRMADKFWGLGEKTPNRTSLKIGDGVVFYVGLPAKVFAGSAVLESNAWKLSEEERDRLWHGKKFYRAEYGVLLKQIVIWDKPRAVEAVLSNLNFIENKEFWYTYLQGGIRQISEADFRTLVLGSPSGELAKQPSSEDLLSRAEFALEAHLEEFVDSNWDSIDFGVKLARYKMDDQSGRQFPAGPWSIDFLCTETVGGDFVVVELKRGKSSDSAVGQILRYMGWVRKNLAKEGQKVKGIIIAKEIDEALSYAVRDLKDVTVLTYSVNFKLLPLKK
jgi:hypothetical protein